MGNNVKIRAEQGHKLIKSALLKVEYELNREESAATPIFFQQMHFHFKPAYFVHLSKK